MIIWFQFKCKHKSGSVSEGLPQIKRLKATKTDQRKGNQSVTGEAPQPHSDRIHPIYG